MNLKNYNWPLILLVTALLSLAGCKSDSMVVPDSNTVVTDGGSSDVGGDVVQKDADNDGISDLEDNCPFDSNSDQTDTDGDGIGDICDTNSDTDSDGIDDSIDNCPAVVNPNQEDIDGDGVGDACDNDKDGDTVRNSSDNCPVVPNTGQGDRDGEGAGDACDTDDDGDSVEDSADNCPLEPNGPNEEGIAGVGNQIDSDGDGIGDACDGLSDTDGDGVVSGDNCPLVSNPDQSDTDNDGTGDACDLDIDGDLVPNDLDNCPLTDNPNQADTDGDGVGDACDLVDDSTYACAATGEQFVPLLAPEANPSDTSSGCLLCDVTNLDNLVDSDLTNAATLVTNLNVAGYVAARVEDASRIYPANNVVGVAVSDPGNALSLDLLNGTTVVTYLDGVPQESNINFDGLGVDLGGLLGGEEITFLTLQTTLPFNGIEVRRGALVDLLSDLNVHAVCASPVDILP